MGDISSIFDRRMFNEIAQLDDGPNRQGLAEITCRRTLVRLRQTAWDYADSKALHEWLGRALTEHDAATNAGPHSDAAGVHPGAESTAACSTSDRAVDNG